MTKINEFDRPTVGDNKQMEWVSDVAAEMLRKLGVKYVALNPGASYRGFHDSLVNYLGNQDPQMLLCLHEDHAVSIAHGYSKVADEMMGTILHSNVGLMHGLMGIFNAWCDRAPIMVMGATGPVDAPLRRPWIDWIHTAKDQGALLRNYVKYDDEPRSAEAIVETMLRANIMAQQAPKGPVYVCLDAGLQETRLRDGEVKIPDVERFHLADPPPASPEAVAATADMIVNAKNVVFMFGRMSAKKENWDRRLELAELVGAGVITDLKNRVVFPTNHGLHVGAPSNWVSPLGQEELMAADVVVAFDWVDLAGSLKPLAPRGGVPGKIVNCTVDSYSHNGWSADHFGMAPADVPVLADPDVFIGQLKDALKSRLDGTSRWDGAAKPKADAPQKEDKAAGAAIAPRDIAHALKDARGDRELTLTRVPLGWASDAWDFEHPLDYMGNDGGGGLGCGPGSAIGVGLALIESERIPVAILGDGDFMQGGSALWTAAHYQIPVLFIISNNRSNFNDEVHQEAMANQRNRPVENRWIGQRIDEPALDLAGYARAQGVRADGPLEKVGDLVAAFEKGLSVVADGEPFLIDVRVQPGYSSPMVTRASGEASTGTAS
ncbi:MAG: thiamine pyrophosphate-dependent enzyme [Pseudomonadota bacterium]|nr:thiamine pyrophosphate-dependent enzyme [Pseudomonadota bacterium]